MKSISSATLYPVSTVFRFLNIRKESRVGWSIGSSLDVIAEVALGVLEVGGGVCEGEAECVADGDERGHEGAEAGDRDRVGIARQGTLEHDVAHEKARGLGRWRWWRRSNPLKPLKRNRSLGTLRLKWM